MSGTANAVRKQTIKSVNMGTDTKQQKMAKNRETGKQNMSKEAEETVDSNLDETQLSYEQETVSMLRRWMVCRSRLKSMS